MKTWTTLSSSPRIRPHLPVKVHHALGHGRSKPPQRAEFCRQNSIEAPTPRSSDRLKKLVRTAGLEPASWPYKGPRSAVELRPHATGEQGSTRRLQKAYLQINGAGAHGQEGSSIRVTRVTAYRLDQSIVFDVEQLRARHGRMDRVDEQLTESEVRPLLPSLPDGRQDGFDSGGISHLSAPTRAPSKDQQFTA